MTAALEGDEWSAARPGRTLPPGKTRYPFYRRLSGPQGPSGRAESLVPTGIRSRTVQPVAQSLYRLSYRAHLFSIPCLKKKVILGKINLWRKNVKLSHYDKIIRDVMPSLRLTSTSPKHVQISATTLTPHRSSCCSVALARDR